MHGLAPKIASDLAGHLPHAPLNGGMTEQNFEALP